MRKQQLRQMKRLRATPEMMELAAKEKPKIEQPSFYSAKRLVYHYGLFMRAQIINGVLMVAFFSVEHMRMGGQTPLYELYIDRDSMDFVTFNQLIGKWRNSRLCMLDWPECVVNGKERWISEADDKRIQQYFGAKNGQSSYDLLAYFQSDVREKQLKARHNKITDPWDIDLAQVPGLPQDWDRWATFTGISEHYLYYMYERKGAKSAYCTFCQNDVALQEVPRHNKAGICPHCQTASKYKAIGKAGTVITDNKIMYLIQSCQDGFVVREFMGFRKHMKENYRTPEVVYQELYREIFVAASQVPRAYEMKLFKNVKMRWVACHPCSPTYAGHYKGAIYGGTLPELVQGELKTAGLVEAINSYGNLDPQKYLAIYRQFPQIEQIAKAKLPHLFSECIDREFQDVVKQFCNLQGSGLMKAMGIDARQLKKFRKANGGWRFLQWLQLEKMMGKGIADDVVQWFLEQRITPREIRFIYGKMSPLQVMNYIKRQMKVYDENSQRILSIWADYYSMAKSLKMDVGDAIIYRVNKLRQRHDELVQRLKDKPLLMKACDILERYPAVEDVMASVKGKYEYTGEEYMIVAPTTVEEIILEGNSLNHCAGKVEYYYDRIETRESFVMFLRRVSEPEKPYYTLEVEPNGTIRQKRSNFDRQYKDIKQVKGFLAEWQGFVAKHLSTDDFQLTERSRILRNKNYAQLREEKRVIQYGDYKGKLLADVLQDDLMETEMAA